MLLYCSKLGLMIIPLISQLWRDGYYTCRVTGSGGGVFVYCGEGIVVDMDERLGEPL